MVLEGEDRLLGHRVDGVRADQLVDVQRVRVGRVLGRGGSPQDPLGSGALGGQVLPPGAAEGLEVVGVGEPRVGDRELALQALVGAHLLQAAVRLGVDARHEEARHRGHRRGVAALGHEPLEAAQVALGDLRVAAQGEDQRDVDRAALGDHVLDRAEPGLGGGDLDQQVGAVDRLVQADRLLEGLERVVGQAGVDLDRHVTVTADAAVPDPAEHVAGLPDVLFGERPEGLGGVAAAVGEFVDLLVVGVPFAHRLLEDRRVGGGADDRVPVDQLLQVPAADDLAGQEVEPHALPEGAQSLQWAVAGAGHVGASFSGRPARATPAPARRCAKP